MTTAMPVPAFIESEQLLSEIRILAKLSPKGYLANEAIKKRQQKQAAFEAKEKARLAQIKANMAHRENALAAAQITQTQHQATVKKRTRITRTNADAAFSLCVRLRANCQCERCGEQFTPQAMKHLHCSHNYSREMKQVRFHPDNAFALCQDCHRWFARDKVNSTAWKNEKLGKIKQQGLLLTLSTQAKTLSKAEEDRIASYYRMASRYLLAEREKGNQSYLPFAKYQKLRHFPKSSQNG